MVSYFVRYQGRAERPESFATYYATRHAAILAEFPGIRSLVLHQPVPWIDPFPVEPDPSFLLAQMKFDSVEALNEALQSDARSRARDDFARFPTFRADVTHGAMRGELIF